MVSHPVETAFILAGGLGTRLRTVVSDVPKPMAPVQGYPFLQHLLLFWQRQGIRRFVISVGYLAEHIQTYFGSSFGQSEVHYVKETSPLGTGGAVLSCLSEFPQRSPFLLLNGDTYFDVDLAALHQYALRQGADICLSVFKTSDMSRYLLLGLSADGIINRNISPEHSVSSNQYFFANGGVYWIDPAAMENTLMGIAPSSFENDLLPELIRNHRRVMGFPSAGPFIDIGIPADYHRAQTLPYFSFARG